MSYIMSEKNDERIKKIDRILRYLLKKETKAPGTIKLAPSMSILVISHALIGDTVMTLPFINILKDRYPTMKITILTDPPAGII